VAGTDRSVALTGGADADADGVFATIAPGQGGGFYLMMVGIAWLWVAFKTPSVLKQFAYHTGVGSLASGATRMGQTIASVVIKKK